MPGTRPGRPVQFRTGPGRPGQSQTSGSILTQRNPPSVSVAYAKPANRSQEAKKRVIPQVSTSAHRTPARTPTRGSRGLSCEGREPTHGDGAYICWPIHFSPGLDRPDGAYPGFTGQQATIYYATPAAGYYKRRTLLCRHLATHRESGFTLAHPRGRTFLRNPRLRIYQGGLGSHHGRLPGRPGGPGPVPEVREHSYPET